MITNTQHIETLTNEFGAGRIKNEMDMSNKLASGMGGVVRFYLEVQSQVEFVKIIKLAQKMNLKYNIVGTGSQTIISDEGFEGLIIKNNTRKFEILSMKGRITNNKINLDNAYLYAESGCILNQAVRYSLEKGMGGLEDLLGTPGSVGGFLKRSFVKNEKNSAIMSLYQIKLIEKSGDIKFIDPGKTPLDDTTDLLGQSDTILSATFLLTPGDEKTLWEKATKKASAKEEIFSIGKPISLIFKDISLAVAMRTPTPGHVRSATELINGAKASGLKIGGATTLTADGNLLLNTGSATTTDILELIKEIRTRVFNKFGVKLEMEINILN